MSDNSVYDSHTLYVRCDNATAAQVRKVFADALANYQRSIGKPVDCMYRVNFIVDREGRSCSTAYVFITNPEIYHMIIGKNPDGTDRVEYVDDPSWEPPAQGEETNSSGWCFTEPKKEPIKLPPLGESLLGINWADLCDSDDEDDYAIVNTEPPKIPCPLPPLITLPPYVLTEEQIEEKRLKIIEENTGKKGFEPEKVTVAPESHLYVARAAAFPLDRKFMPNILKTKNVPNWITAKDLKAQFSPYASDNKTLQERVIKGTSVWEPYPFVNFNDDRVAFVVFDPSTNDAQFALYMMRKTVITKQHSSGKTFTHTLIFGHSYCKDRDDMSKITQQPRLTEKSYRGNNRTNNQGNYRGKPYRR